MVPESSRASYVLTFLMTAIAGTATEIAVVDTRSVWTSVGLASIWVALTLFVGAILRPRQVRADKVPRWLAPVLFVLAAAPFAADSLWRSWFNLGYPLELKMVLGFRNLGLGLAAFAFWPQCLRLGSVVSLFLIVFCLVMTEHPAVVVLLGLYSVVGSCWLMCQYWSRLKPATDESTRVTIDVQSRRQVLPWFPIVLFLFAISSAVWVASVGPKRAARILGEWLPTSGGTGDYDPFARGGVNDGDDEVRGDNARSTGTVESESFLDSPLPSLYDVTNDMYGEPFKPKKDVESAIALDSTKNRIIESRKPPADNLRPNREFATQRRKPRERRDPADRAARALFEVEGRTPLHIRATAFDWFDGKDWSEGLMNSGAICLEKEKDSTWIQVQGRTPPAIYGPPENHKFKIAAPIGQLVPTPPSVARFRVGLVNRANFFNCAQEGIFRMADRTTPPGIVVETQCSVVDSRKLGHATFHTKVIGTRLCYDQVPKSLDPEVVALAQQWAEGRPTGWPQIQAVIGHLRAEYTVDRTWTIPGQCNDPLRHFLLESRRGPDYQFATAACILLRVLGYSTRLVNGFYASPDHYDADTDHTPVVPEDLHFWSEVQLSNGDWLVLEPTPGYEVLTAGLHWTERLTAFFGNAMTWVQDHWWGLSGAILALGLLFWQRNRVIDRMMVAWWRLFPGASWQRSVQRVLAILERRGWCAGISRPQSETPARWLQSYVSKFTAIRNDLETFSRMVTWASYAGNLPNPWPEAEVFAICARMVGSSSRMRAKY